MPLGKPSSHFLLSRANAAGSTSYHFGSQQDASSGNQIPTDAEARGPFNDFVPFVSNYVYRDSVKKVQNDEKSLLFFLLRLFKSTLQYIIQPIIKGTKCLVPRRAVAYYKSNLAHRRFFKLTSPVYTAVSIYANKKLEQGVYWTLNRGFRWVRDNVFTND